MVRSLSIEWLANSEWVALTVPVLKVWVDTAKLMADRKSFNDEHTSQSRGPMLQQVKLPKFSGAGVTWEYFKLNVKESHLQNYAGIL